MTKMVSSSLSMNFIDTHKFYLLDEQVDQYTYHTLWKINENDNTNIVYNCVRYSATLILWSCYYFHSLLSVSICRINKMRVSEDWTSLKRLYNRKTSRETIWSQEKLRNFTKKSWFFFYYFARRFKSEFIRFRLNEDVEKNFKGVLPLCRLKKKKKTWRSIFIFLVVFISTRRSTRIYPE